MTWRTHAAVGANAIWLAGFLGKLDESILVYLPVAIVASLLPDIDASAAKIHYAAGGVLGVFKGAFYGKYFHHRGLMHSILVILIFFIILWLIFRGSYPLLPYIFALSYFSHIVIDGFNTGVGYLYPFIHKRFALLPRALLGRVSGVLDTFLMFIGITFLLLFFLLFAHQLLPAEQIGAFRP